MSAPDVVRAVRLTAAERTLLADMLLWRGLGYRADAIPVPSDSPADRRVREESAAQADMVEALIAKLREGKPV